MYGQFDCAGAYHQLKLTKEPLTDAYRLPRFVYFARLNLCVDQTVSWVLYSCTETITTMHVHSLRSELNPPTLRNTPFPLNESAPTTTFMHTRVEIDNKFVYCLVRLIPLANDELLPCCESYQDKPPAVLFSPPMQLWSCIGAPVFGTRCPTTQQYALARDRRFSPLSFMLGDNFSSHRIREPSVPLHPDAPTPPPSSFSLPRSSRLSPPILTPR